MHTNIHPPYREWSRYQWAGVNPVPDEPDVARWNLAQWQGDQGAGGPVPRVDPATLSAGDGGYSGFGHNPGGGSRWALGYGH